jgi:LacI family transcriptional regulator/LacI family repressor for deo operon, udp, cdd, tsx, nupC, and nupG
MASLKEVAKKASVSISTVSRVINNPKIVRADTKEKVQQAMESLNFQPNRVAQRLRVRNGNSKLLGLIIPDIQNPFYSKIVRGIEDVAYEKDYAVMLCNSDENMDKELFYMQIMESESVDGIIMLPMANKNDQLSENLNSNRIPIICVDRKFIDHTTDNVVINNIKGGKLAVSHFADLNHKKIAIITSSFEISSFQKREEGYRQTLIDYNLKIQPEFIKRVDPRSSQEAEKATHQLFKLESPPTALFLTNNLLALGALKAINKLELQIPKDISIIMFDDLPWAAAIDPPLTTVKQPGYEMGKKAADLFFNRIENPEGSITEIKMVPKLIIRSSTKCL